MTDGHERTLFVAIFVSIMLLGFVVPNLPSNQRIVMLDTSEISEASIGTIVIDYSHGQESSFIDVVTDDAELETELEALGYNVIWARGGLNSTILESADGLLLGSIVSESNKFQSSEITAISDWFASGARFLWVGCDSDYTSLPLAGQFVNDNMTAVLESVYSHVYPEPTAVEDPVSNNGAAYRPIANETSSDLSVSDIVEDVQAILMHGPTLLYGSQNAETPGPGISPVSLEDITINNVYPLLYYSEFATIVDSDLTNPVAHLDRQTGSFVASTLEINAGPTGRGTIIVSGASPYGDYRSMHTDYYYDVSLNGSIFVPQAIDFCMHLRTPSIDNPSDVTYEEGQDIYYDFENITWHPYSTMPKSYNITLDETLITNGLWNSSSEEFSVNIEGLSHGIHNYTITVENELNQTTTDDVQVTVLAPAAPIINHPEDISYTVGEIGNMIHWEISDTSFKNYSIYRNGAFLVGTANAISLGPHSLVEDRPVDGYGVGLYNFTIVVVDWLDLVSTDTVMVEVLEPTTTTTTTPTSSTTTTTSDITSTTSTTSSTNDTGLTGIFGSLTFVISVGSIVIIIIVIVLIKRQT